MTEHVIDPHARYDARLGWPLCECGHSWSLHTTGGGQCNRIECMGVQMGPCCRFYRPQTPIPIDSPAMFADMVRGMVGHCLPRDGHDYDRHDIAGLVCSIVAQLAVQWSGWKPEGDQS